MHPLSLLTRIFALEGRPCHHPVPPLGRWDIIFIYIYIYMYIYIYYVCETDRQTVLPLSFFFYKPGS